MQAYLLHRYRRLNAAVEHTLLEQLTFLSNASIVREDVDTQVELTSSRKWEDTTQTIARKRWHSARIY